jgi:hypothetical protein
MKIEIAGHDGIPLEEIPTGTYFVGRGRDDAGCGVGGGLWFKTSTHLVGLQGSVYELSVVRHEKFYGFRAFRKMLLFEEE